MRLKTEDMSTGKTVAIILVICCVGAIIIGLASNMMSPDQNTAPQTNTTSSVDNSTSTNTSTSDNSQQTYPDGTYKVGQDIPPGEYKFTQTDEFGGYIERSSDSSMEFDSIIANEATSEKGETAYVTIKKGEYIKVQGGELVKESSE